MYFVRWNDHEGNLKEKPFGSSEKALLAAESLRRNYDFVEVIRAGGGKAEDEQAKGSAEPWPVRRRRLAEACPWRLEDDTVGKRIDYEQVRALYDQGLNDSAIAERMEVSDLTIQRWRKKNNLPTRGRMKQEKPEAPVEPVTAAEAPVEPEAPPEWDVSARIRQLMALVRPEDSEEARVLAARLAGQWIADFLSAGCTETCNKTGSSPYG